MMHIVQYTGQIFSPFNNWGIFFQKNLAILVPLVVFLPIFTKFDA